MKEGKLLGYIVSKEGNKIDLERVEKINPIGLPRKRKEILSLLGFFF